jgi:hypothetical protein
VVLAWYGQAHAAGMRAEVTEAIALEHAVVLGLTLSGPALGPNGKRPGLVFQVLRLAEGLVVDIRGFQRREQALAHADKPVPKRD